MSKNEGDKSIMSEVARELNDPHGYGHALGRLGSALNIGQAAYTEAGLEQDDWLKSMIRTFGEKVVNCLRPELQGRATQLLSQTERDSAGKPKL